MKNRGDSVKENKIKKLKCPICKKLMVMRDVFDGAKELICEPCSVIKQFNSWEEQIEYEKLYKE